MASRERAFSIGRARTCDVVLADPSVSRHHADLRVLQDGTLVLVDLGSSNGTALVEGAHLRPLGEQRINPADVLQFGDVRMTAADLLRRAGVAEPPRFSAPFVPPVRGTPPAAGRHLERCARCGAIKETGHPCRECAA